MSVDRSFARSVQDWLEDDLTAVPDPRPVYDRVFMQLPTTPQRRRWWSDRWSTRGRRAVHGDDVHGSRKNERTRRMYGFATLLAAGAIGGAALLAGFNQQTEPGPRTIVVAQDGSGDVGTIAEGVALAVDGDTVLIRPGVYPESLIITTDITIMGDGPREEVIVETSSDGPPSSDPRAIGSYALQLDETTATIRGLTLRGEHSRVIINGGAPTLEDLHVQDVDLAYTGGGGSSSAIHINAGSQAVIRDSLLEGGGAISIFDGSSPLIEDNVLRDGPHVWVSDGTGGGTPVLRGNVIEGFYVRGIGVFTPTNIVIEGNTIRGSGDGILLGDDAPYVADLRGNTIEVGGIGIEVGRTAPTIAENDISGAATGIYLGPGGAATLTGNTIHNNRVGIRFSGGTPTIQRNTLCDNQQNVQATSNAAPVDLTGNEVCPELGTPAPSTAP